MLKRIGSLTRRKLFFDHGMWQFCHWFAGTTIDVAEIHIKSAADVVRYSFIAHKSLTYLDLSVGEYGKHEKLCFTTDAYKKNVLSKRYILYSHHLDVSRELDDTSEFSALHYKTSSETESFFLKKVSIVDENVYNMNIKPYVVAAIRKSNNKIRALMKYYKLLIIQKEDFANNYFLYMQLISNERRDSELVCQLLKEHQFYAIHIFFQHYDEHLVGFALYHATRAKCRLFEEIPFSWSSHLFYGRYECFYQLIKYGYNYPFFSGDFLPCLRDAADNFLFRDSSIKRKWDFCSSYRRQNIFTLTIIFLLFRSRDGSVRSIDLVDILWEAIPDPFFTRAEISEGCEKLRFNEKDRNFFLKFYEDNVSLEFLLGTTPRSLFHLCRCSIRDFMGSSFKLPHGIDGLNIPNKMKEFLRLNITDQPF